MFGYVKPVVGDLFVKEHEFYRATYCGICRAMKSHTGFLSNILHSYDSVFLALVRMLYVDSSEIKAQAKRCIAHPMKKRPMLVENEALEYTARAFGILTYYKLCDDVQDEKLRRRIAVNTIKPIFSRAKNRAAMEPLADTIRDRLARITKIEKEKLPSVDEPAGLFGELLGEIFAYDMPKSERATLYSVGYYLGKFIYAADAAEDYDKDLKSGSYNPFCLIYDGGELTDENRATIKCALLMDCRALEDAIMKLPFGNNVGIENILRNIIYLGLPERISFLDKKECGACKCSDTNGNK